MKNNYLTKQQVQELITGLKIKESQADEFFKGLTAKGYTLEGYNDGSKGSINESTLSKIGGAIKNVATGIKEGVVNAANNINDINNQVYAKGSQEYQKYQAGEQSIGTGIVKSIGGSAQGALQESGQIANATVNTPIMEAVGGAFNIVDAVAQGKLSQAGQEILATPVGQEALQVLQGGMDKYNQWKIANPNKAKNIEAVINIASLVPAIQGVKDVALGTKAVVGATKDALGTVIKDTSNLVNKTTGNITNKLNLAKSAKSEIKALEAITPDVSQLSANEYEKLLNTKKIQPRSGVTGKPEYILSEDEINLAKKHSSLLQSNDPAKNSINVMNEIANTDSKVASFLTENNGFFNTGKLKNRLKTSLSDIQDLTIPEARLNKIKTSIIDSFLKGLDKNDMKTLWEKRKAFDSQIENAFKGSYSVTKDVKVKFRNAIQDFIAENTPDGVYKGYMKDMSNLYRMNDIIASKASAEKNANAIMSWIKRNPTKAKIIGYTAGSGVGVGIIGSLVK